MKKKFLSLILIILAYFLAINIAYCKEDFFNQQYENATPQEKTVVKKKQKKSKDNKEALKGYYGKLPDIYKDFQYKKQNAPSSTEIDMKIPTKEDLAEENLKEAPTNDALFLDVIVKKDRTSQYINDIQKTKYALETLKKCIEEKGEIQRYNACINVVDLYVQNLQEKYKDKSESFKTSFSSILAVNNQAKTLGNLMYSANYYARYIPVQEGQYSKENIEQEQQNLLHKINKTLFLISEEN